MSPVMKRFDLTRTDKVILAVAAVYLLSPFDLIPEIIAGPLGLTDDLAALALVGMILMRAHRREKRTTGDAPHELHHTNDDSSKANA